VTKQEHPLEGEGTAENKKQHSKPIGLSKIQELIPRDFH
jgi:hypothetical protein